LLDTGIEPKRFEALVPMGATLKPLPSKIFEFFATLQRRGTLMLVNDNVVGGLIDKAGIVSQLLLPELQEDPSPDSSGYPATGCREEGLWKKSNGVRSMSG
jgi:hypothetical protein